jgi:hypothetical protein
MGEPNEASPFRTFHAGRSDRDEARLRSTAAIVTALGAGLYAIARPGGLAIVVSLAALAAGVAWRRRANAAFDRVARNASLILDANGVELRVGDDARRTAWSEIARVELDEDLLVVRLILDGQEDVVIEPIYEGASLQDLADAVAAARKAAKERPANDVV